jgi:hypothetical protein
MAGFLAWVATPPISSLAALLLLLWRQLYLYWERRQQMRLSKDDILKAEDLVSEEIDVPEWGGSVLVRGLTGRERDEFEASIMERRGRRMYPNIANVRAKLVARCCIDDSGQRLFTDFDAEELGAKAASAMNRLYDVAARLSGMTEEDIEELVENFGETPSAGSSSGSPKTKAGRSGTSSAH